MLYNGIYVLFLKLVYMNNKENGFSLVEMSVVLVIVALILGAAMQGKNMMEGAKIRAILSETSKYKVSINSFYSKYDQFPGDFSKAADYWGATTKSGDGDGQIEFINTAATPVYEGFRAWQHLAFAGMITIPLTGTGTTTAAVIDTDVPASIAGGGYFLEYGVFSLSGVNSMVLGAPVATAAAPILVGGTLTPTQSMDLDSKIDDGAPSAGTVRGNDGYASPAAPNTCVTVGATYAITLTGKDCTIGMQTLKQ
jgi:prepilin-type N-terminal cleavage/methylation domain-containing protein